MTATVTTVITEQNVTNVTTEQNVTNVATEQNTTTIVTVGSQGPPGIVGINWLGTYSSVYTYSIRDAVYYNGSSYYCIQSTLGHVPTNTSYWNVIAQQGSSGVSIADEGSSGTGTVTESFVASETISGFKVVKENSSGSVSLADKDQSDYGASIIGVSTTSGGAGSSINVLRLGKIEDYSLNLTTGPLFLGSNGDITSSIPTSGIIVQVGSAIGTGIAEINIGVPIIRS